MSGQENGLAGALSQKKRTVVLGVGSELRCDDGAGMYVAKLLEKHQSDAFLVLGGGSAPENFTGVIRRFLPERLVVVDAAFMDLLPGQYAVLPVEGIAQTQFTTHMLPLSVMLNYLAADLAMEILCIGIQPVFTGQGMGIDPRVKAGCETLAGALAAALGQTK